MASLAKELRKQLESAVRKARRVSEAGARKALEGLAVAHHEPWPSMSKAERDLRNRLRAHGRQLGDKLDEKRGTQEVKRLAVEAGYEQWHRMLFARFLAECDLLIEPESGVAVSIDEVRELAREQGGDWIELASGWAQRMLPQIFRSGDPVLEVSLPPESRQELEALLEALPREVFVADDSLGWCYQFWQAERKDEVNASGVKIGADELPAVTQLFTEDYMVDFLLDNTLGAWWAGKKLAENPKLASESENEEELRKAVALPGTPWSYLRFVKADDGRWTPAAGTFDGWPKSAKEITCLDPCMGSGHFIVGMFVRLIALRLVEEKLDDERAIAAVIEENLFGLEIDPRCTQIAAFALALAAWSRVGHCPLPSMNLACSGLAPQVSEAEWTKLAAGKEKHERGMRRLFHVFGLAPVLGSLLDLSEIDRTLLETSVADLASMLETVLAEQAGNAPVSEMAAAAQGIAKAAEILTKQFTVVATNVPYLGMNRQSSILFEYLRVHHAAAKADLATAFIQRCLRFCGRRGTTAILAPQIWLFLGSYKGLRLDLLKTCSWNGAVRLGTGAFETIGGEVVNVGLFMLSNEAPREQQVMFGIDVCEQQEASGKAQALKTSQVLQVSQRSQLKNPDARVTLDEAASLPLLAHHADSYWGIGTGDVPRFARQFIEFARIEDDWRPLHVTSPLTSEFTGREQVVDWRRSSLELCESDGDRELWLANRWGRGSEGWQRTGVAVSQMGELDVTLYTGEIYQNGVAAIVPKDPQNLGAVWAFCSSDSFKTEVRRIDKKLSVTNLTLIKVPFDLAYWQRIAKEKYPVGLPRPHSSNPAQWLFDGHPAQSDSPLHVAVARLLGYSWPRQTGMSFRDCPAVGPDGLERHSDDDGIVCLSAVRGESGATDRLLALLADAYGRMWSPAKLNELLTAVGCAGNSLEDWLRDEFPQQHCAIFSHRPFIWQVWDGVRNGFSALVNYHKLAGPRGEGRKTLERLIFTYLGDWTERQRKEQMSGVEGADLRLAAAEHLKAELEKILHGEPPYDIFVRWKPLHEQPIGWDPDINDGVRINIRPFMSARPLNARGKNACILRATPNIKWTKDRGKEPTRPKDEFPWFWGWDERTPDFAGGKSFDGNRWNDLHYTRSFKEEARKRHKEKRR